MLTCGKVDMLARSLVGVRVVAQAVGVMRRLASNQIRRRRPPANVPVRHRALPPRARPRPDVRILGEAVARVLPLPVVVVAAHEPEPLQRIAPR